MLALSLINMPEIFLIDFNKMFFIMQVLAIICVGISKMDKVTFIRILSE